MGAFYLSFVVGLSLCFDQFKLYVNLAWQILFHQPLEDIVTFILFWLIIFALLYLLLRTPKPAAKDDGEAQSKPVDFVRMNVAFNVMCTILLFVNLVPIEISDWEQHKVHEHFIQMFRAPFQSVSFKNGNGPKPDVYYIILDAYANPNTLENQGHFDDRDFLDFLKGHGFYVVPRAASNYDRTPFSISSSLNMDYIQAVPKEMGDNFVADNIYYRLMQSSVVAGLFKKLGYKFVNVSSGAFATDNIPAAEFVLIHTDLSHPPPLFEKDGRRKDLPREILNDHSTDFGAYVEQIKFCNSEVQKWIEKIDQAKGEKPVIILQADHGTYYPMKSDDAYYNEVMRILNAYRFAGDKNPTYYPTITPVNSFRVLFNDYFGAGMPLLKDQSWCSPVRVRPYNWSDVTPKLVFPLADAEKTK
jgi:hypothetical protein